MGTIVGCLGAPFGEHLGRQGGPFWTPLSVRLRALGPQSQPATLLQGVGFMRWVGNCGAALLSGAAGRRRRTPAENFGGPRSARAARTGTRRKFRRALWKACPISSAPRRSPRLRAAIKGTCKRTPKSNEKFRGGPPEALDPVSVCPIHGNICPVDNRSKSRIPATIVFGFQHRVFTIHVRSDPLSPIES